MSEKKEKKKLEGCPLWKVPCIKEDCHAYRSIRHGVHTVFICHALGGIKMGKEKNE